MILRITDRHRWIIRLLDSNCNISPCKLSSAGSASHTAGGRELSQHSRYKPEPCTVTLYRDHQLYSMPNQVVLYMHIWFCPAHYSDPSCTDRWNFFQPVTSVVCRFKQLYAKCPVPGAFTIQRARDRTCWVLKLVPLSHSFSAPSTGAAGAATTLLGRFLI